MIPLSTALQRSPASIAACSVESTISFPARVITASSTSLARQVVGPAPINVLPSLSQAPSTTGSMVAAMQRTMSQSRTASSLLATAETSTPMVSVIRQANSSRRSWVRLYALIFLIPRTLDNASNWVGACPPVPMMPTVASPGLAKCFTATPVVAPVRS